MNPRRKFVLVAVLLAILAIGGAWRQTEIGRAQRAAWDAQNRRLADMRQRVAALESEQRGASLTEQADRNRLSNVEAQLAATAHRSAQTTAAALASKPSSALRFMESEAHFRAMLPIRYRSLWRKYKLTPDQIAAFENAETDAQRKNMETMAERESGKLDFAAAEKAFASARQDRDEVLKSLLGPDGFQEYQKSHWSKYSQAKGFVASLAGDLYASDAPLTGSQGAQLTQTIFDHTHVEKKPLPARGGGNDTLMVPVTDWSAVASAAATFLSPEQQAAVELRAKAQPRPVN